MDTPSEQLDAAERVIELVLNDLELASVPRAHLPYVLLTASRLLTETWSRLRDNGRPLPGAPKEGGPPVLRFTYPRRASEESGQ